MFKQYLETAHTYFSFGVVKPSIMVALISTALLRTACFLVLPFIASEIVNAVVQGDWSRAQVIATIFLVVGLLYVFFRHLYSEVCLRHYQYAHNRFQYLMLEKVATFDNNYTEEFPSAFIINAAFSSISYAPDFLTQLIDLIIDIFALTISCIILLIFDSPIGIVASLFIIIAVIALSYNFNRYERFSRLQLHHQDAAANLMNEVIDGRKEVKVFNLGQQLSKLLSENQAERRAMYRGKHRYRNRTRIIIPAFLGFGRVLIYLLAIALVLSDSHHNVAALVLAIGYYATIETDFGNIRQIFSNFSNNVVHVRRIHQILSYRTHHMSDFGSYNRTQVDGKIEFANVSFFHHRRALLRDINLTISPYKFVAIVGKSGAGKSTLFRLLLRFYKPSRGKILLDDINIQRYTREAYAINVAMVSQKPFVFDLSIRENLNLIDENPTHQEAVCRAVGLHDDIMKLPRGYDTKLSADAADFSSGQKQLFALARTLLTGSEVLLFDEITAPLDVRTSKQIFAILRKLKKSHTILAITHKPYLMEYADEIIVMDKGRIVGRGTHAELIKNNKYYQAIHPGTTDL